MTDVTSSDGVRLAVTTWGSPTSPVVVLVHGLGLSVRSWGRVPELLAPAHRVVAYDLRGHGQSAKAPHGDYSLSAHARDLHAVLCREVVDGQRAVVVGSSLGGGIILAHAQDFPHQLIAGAVFAGSGGSGVTFPGLPARWLPRRAQRGLRSAWLLLIRGAALVGRHVRPVESVANRLVRPFAFTSDAPRSVVDQVREDFLGTRPAALARTTLASVSNDGVRLAPSLEVPTLVLHGDRDPEVSQEEIHELMAALPQAELVTFPGTGHMLPLTDADAVTAQIARWVRRVESALWPRRPVDGVPDDEAATRPAAPS